jgi:hypothetical protein
MAAVVINYWFRTEHYVGYIMRQLICNCQQLNINFPVCWLTDFFIILANVIILVWLDSSRNPRDVALTVVAVRLVRTSIACIAEKRTNLAVDGHKCTTKFWKRY